MQWRRLGLLLALVAAANAEAAYSRRVWQSADGLPEDFAQALAQTPDGYLWIGTSGGLVRFDGIRFTVFNAFPDDSIYSLLTARDGTLWAGTEGGGLIRYRHGAFRVFGAEEGLTNRFVRVIYEDREGVLWVGTDNGLFRMQAGKLVRAYSMAVHSICQDRAGRLLVGGSGLLVVEAGRQTFYQSSETLADNSIRTIGEADDGTLWIGTISGLRRLPGGISGDPFGAPKIIRDTNIAVLTGGRKGALWIGTYGQGLMRYEDGKFTRYTAPSALPHNNVLAVFEDREDNVWIGTQGGLLRMSPSAATTVTTSDGVPQSINTIYHDRGGRLFVAALNGRLFEVAHKQLEPARLPPAAAALKVRNAFRDRSGALWIGTDGQGAARIEGGVVERFTMKDGLANDFVRAFCEDHDGSIWIGTDGALSRRRGGTFRNYTTEDGLAYASIRALLLDRDGSLWIATDGGLSHFRSDRFVRDPLLDRFRGLKVWSLYQDADGGLWIGTHGAGLFLLKDGRLSQWTTRQGLPSDKVHFIAEGPKGNLWMSGPAGVVAVARHDLESGSGQLSIRVYNTSDGLSTNQMSGGVQPAGAVTPDGEFWFPSTKGMVEIAPEGPVHAGAPPVVIERVLADDRETQVEGEVRAGPGAGKLEIHYTAIRLRSPEQTRFRFWMENFDKDWTDAGQRRIAYYTNMPAGRYRFHVMAYELTDPRNATERVIGIEWRPHFYRTAWFLALCLVAAGGAAWIAYRVHVRNLRKRFEAVLEERSRLAREMHDTLIQGCVGVSTLLEAASSAGAVSPGMRDELLDRARNEVRATVDEARIAVWNLRQSGGGLLAAVSQLSERIGRESGITVRQEITGVPFALGDESERSVLMLVREAVQNAVRHAAPERVLVALRFQRDQLQVMVEDDGSGFDPDARQGNGHYGLIGMRERVAKLGGDFGLDSAPGRGTRVVIRLPRK